MLKNYDLIFKKTIWKNKMYLGVFFSTNIIMVATVSSLSYFFLKFCFRNSLDKKIFNFIFFYHLVFIFYFFIFAKNNDSDSLKYFYDASNGFFFR